MIVRIATQWQSDSRKLSGADSQFQSAVGLEEQFDLDQVADGRLMTRVGQRTATNLAERSALSLVWQPVDGGEYQLIVDGVAEHVDAAEGPEGVAAISIVVTRGILHRLAGLPNDGPSCVALDG